MPPTGISTAQLWAEITQSPRPHRLVDFPRLIDGETIQVAMWVMTQEESFLANLESEKYVRKMLKEHLKEVPKSDEMAEGYNRIFELRASIEILWRVCRDPADVSKSFFRSKEEIGKYLTPDEIGVLMKEYNVVRTDLGPIVTTMSDAEVEAWIERLASAESAFPLAFMSWEGVTQLVTSMARRLVPSPTGSDSPSGQPDESESES
ncbi:hypothetical protein [Polyangium spumosum]|uniref:Uncharacterized protein n=1 Tax=Polyangium spumosum TaxID=889282 RepID=A0A6N7Q2F0_9BACT|nr:hypothetical protein [Polyangium spumosum]MRG98209.1 hypothetical protein [Polyangium spumosum]